MNWQNVFWALLALAVLSATVTFFPPPKYQPEAQSAPAASEKPVKCRSLPTHVINYGITLQATGGDLYLCFQQATLNKGNVVQGMTEVTCVPMKDCPR